MVADSRREALAIPLEKRTAALDSRARGCAGCAFFRKGPCHMLTQEQNDLICRTGPGTPGGEFMRRYWQPVALAEELPPGGAPIPVELLSEKLTLYRDEHGNPCLIARRCPHRGADLS